VLTIRLSRENWLGPNVPGHAVVRIGTLVTPSKATLANPCYQHPCASTDPHIGKVTAVRRWTASSGAVKVFRLPVRTPFRVELTVNPTFRPVDFGRYDTRDLSVQPTFTFTPAR
jgi:hypothetical protein